MKPCYCTMLRTANRRIAALYDEALAPLGINIAQYSLMRRIKRYQPVSFTQLGHEADLDRSTISRNVKVLEKSGLASTGRGETDHREIMVSLTREGEQVLRDALPVWKQCQEEMESRIGTEKMKIFEDIVRSM